MASPTVPIACTLSPDQAAGQLQEWSDLRQVATHVEQLDDGATIRLPSERADEAKSLAHRESRCCSFLNIEFAERPESIEMTITSPNPDGVSVVHLLAGIDER